MKELPIKPPSFDDKYVKAQIEEINLKEKAFEKRTEAAKNTCFIIIALAYDLYFATNVEGADKSSDSIFLFLIGLIPAFLMTPIVIFILSIPYWILFSWNIGKLFKSLYNKWRENRPHCKLKKKYQHIINQKNIYESLMSRYNEEYKGFDAYGLDRERYVKDKIEEIIIKVQEELKTLDKMVEKEWWVDLTPEDFENEVSKWYAKQGYSTKTTSYSADGGVDVIADKGDEKLYIQCKHYNRNTPIGVNVVRELFGVVMADKATKGVLVCLYPPTQGACEFAHKCGIEIITADILASKSNNAIRQNKDVIYYDNNAIIGHTAPYVFVGKIGIIFNVFHSKDDAITFKQQVLYKFPYATIYYNYASKLYFILCSNDANIIKMNLYDNNNDYTQCGIYRHYVKHSSIYKKPSYYKSYNRRQSYNSYGTRSKIAKAS